MPQYDVNQPPQKIPDKWVNDIDLRFFLNEMVMFFWQLWNRVTSDNTDTDPSEISAFTDMVYVSGGGTTIMPDISGAKQRVTIKNIGTTSQTITTPDTALIEGEVDAILPPEFSYTLSPDGTNWYIV